MRFFSLLICCLLFLTSQGQTYQIDPGLSSIQVKVQRFGGVYVIGRFKKIEGNILYPKNEVQDLKAEVLIDANSYDANNSRGEASIKSKAFLDVEQYPSISFTSERVERVEDQLYLVGKLSIHGVSNTVRNPFEITGPSLEFAAGRPAIAASGKLTINRQDYGINFNKQTSDGTKFVGDEVEISLMIHAIEKKV